MGKNTKPVWDECKHTWKIVVWVMVWSKPCCCFICRYGYTKGGGGGWNSKRLEIFFY